LKTIEKKDSLGSVVLLLTTTNRNSRQPMVSAVRYEDYKGEHCLIIPRRTRIGWYMNILASPWVDVEVHGRKYHALAEPVTDNARIADLFREGLANRSPMIVSLARSHGLPSKPSRGQLEALGSTQVVIFLHKAKE
jgi:F420H(2)-dependent quinone reductase